jgi:hypothetical protein
MMSRNDLIDVMKKITATVIFEKVDGTLRTMNCTLKPEYLPVLDENTTMPKKARKINHDCLAVWDLENNEWRSFRLDSVKNISFTL